MSGQLDNLVRHYKEALMELQCLLERVFLSQVVTISISN